MTDTSATLGEIGEILERAKQVGRVTTWRSGVVSLTLPEGRNRRPQDER